MTKGSRKQKHIPQDVSVFINKKVNWSIAESAIYVAGLALFWLKPLLQGLSYGNLDPSFIYGVEKAALERISFGNHFIATYGPFSYAVNNFLPQDVIRTMIWQIVAVFAAGVGIYLFSKLYLSEIGKVKYFLNLILMLSLSLAIPEWFYLNTFLIYLFIYIRAPQSLKNYLRILLPLASALLMLTKFTEGAASIAALVFAEAFANLKRNEDIKLRLKNLAFVIFIYLVFLTVIAFILGTTDIVSYLVANIRMSNGFQDAMSSITPMTSVGAKFAAAGFIIFFIWIVVTFKEKALNYSFLLPVFYIVWKYSIVREDGHILTLVAVLPTLVLLVYALNIKNKWHDGVFAVLVLGCAVIAIWGAQIPFSEFQANLSNPINNIQTHGLLHFFEIHKEEETWKVQTNAGLSNAHLPSSMIKLIGNQGVDIYPWEASLIYANNLNWHNRPSPFSFESYTPQFDEDNANFFENNGPPFIIWHSFSIDGVSGIDGRTDLWDEPNTLKVILAKYKYVSSTSQFILLERISHPTQSPNFIDNGAPVHIGVGSAVVPQTNNLECVNISIKDNVREKLKTLLVRERPFNINLLYSDGTHRYLRFVRETANDGLLINQLPRSWSQLISLLEYHQTTDRVDQFAVIAEPSTTVSFYNCLK
ncbi:MAG TPA: hypothetical protein VL989_03610 [Candidatus Sulfotelmatobacter sp.]|nr:hypothetical protein [Candidatus Sulfotelmatobacter sp.]